MYFNRFTQGAKAAIDLGKNCAKSLGHRVVGTEHLVVGLLREKDGIAARVLKNLGMDVNTFENKLIEIEGKRYTYKSTFKTNSRKGICFC